jgi:hypothetical protein
VRRHQKVGSSGNIRLFKQSVNHITKHNHLPEYNLRIEGENVIFNYKDYQEKIA